MSTDTSAEINYINSIKIRYNNMIMLSLLIPVIPEHYPQFMKLLAELQKQVTQFHAYHSSLGLIEILFDNSESYLRGGKSIGCKRNFLRQRALGKYSMYIDADEDVSPNLVETIMRLCQEDRDCVSYRVIFKNDYYWTIVNMSIENEEDEQANPDRIIQRRIWHVCAIKTEITMTEHFNELNHNEDGDWLARILPRIKSESHSDRVLLQYNHSEKNSEADKILKSGYK